MKNQKVEKDSQGNVFLQAASYDFDLPLMINGVRWPIASPSPFPTPSSPSISSSLSDGSRKHVVKSLLQSVTMATRQSQHIQATGGVINAELCVCVLVSDIYILNSIHYHFATGNCVQNKCHTKFRYLNVMCVFQLLSLKCF